MGADIHLYLERRIKGRPWSMVRDLNYSIDADSLSPWAGDKDGTETHWYWRLSSRNYALFANLAGVRGPGPEPRGLPNDVSYYVEEESAKWAEDGHSHSWSTPLEFMEAYTNTPRHDYEEKALDKYVQIRMTEGVEMAVGIFLREMCSIDINFDEEYRFVYWFDN